MAPMRNKSSLTNYLYSYTFSARNDDFLLVLGFMTPFLVILTTLCFAQETAILSSSSMNSYRNFWSALRAYLFNSMSAIS